MAKETIDLFVERWYETDDMSLSSNNIFLKRIEAPTRIFYVIEANYTSTGTSLITFTKTFEHTNQTKKEVFETLIQALKEYEETPSFSFVKKSSYLHIVNSLSPLFTIGSAVVRRLPIGDKAVDYAMFEDYQGENYYISRGTPKQLDLHSDRIMVLLKLDPYWIKATSSNFKRYRLKGVIQHSDPIPQIPIPWSQMETTYKKLTYPESWQTYDEDHDAFWKEDYQKEHGRPPPPPPPTLDPNEYGKILYEVYNSLFFLEP
jgi:hypothetical protein